MKDAHIVYEEFKPTAERWLSELAEYSPERFLRKPSEEEWSVGQLYQHLVVGTRRMHLRNVERCLTGEEVEEGEKNERGEMLFSTGSFPPVQIKVPASPEYTPAQPESVESVRASLASLVDEMAAARDRVASMPSLGKTLHRGFGLLDAAEWYELIEMHFRHHLRQKERLDAWLMESVEN
jgi:hypothetical protein